MADYKEKIEEWQQAALRKAKELDEKFAISDLVGEGAKAASDAARKGAETVAQGAEKLRAEAENRLSEENVGESARKAAVDAVRGAKKAGDAFRALQVRRARKLAWSSMKRRPTTTAPRILLIVARSLLVLQPPQLLDY
jgi:hypothetical protein